MKPADILIAVMGARSFQLTTGVERFLDAKDLGARDVEPDSFFYDKALQLMGQQPPNKPLFTFIYLGANHFPWETRYRPDLLPNWRAPGNVPSIDEYLRRQAMSAEQYKAFVAGLKKNFPSEPFLIVRYGDHQPEFAPNLLEPGLDEGAIGKKLDAYDPRLYATYYAIDAVNFEPVKTEAVMDTVDGPYLPLVIQEAAGIPLDPSFAEQKQIMPIDDAGEQELVSAAAQEQRLIYQDVLSKLAKLPEEQRAVLLLVGVEDLSYADAAAVLNVPVGTVMSRLSRARERLQQEMDGVAPGNVVALRSLK